MNSCESVRLAEVAEKHAERPASIEAESCCMLWRRPVRKMSAVRRDWK